MLAANQVLVLSTSSGFLDTRSKLRVESSKRKNIEISSFSLNIILLSDIWYVNIFSQSILYNILINLHDYMYFYKYTLIPLQNNYFSHRIYFTRSIQLCHRSLDSPLNHATSIFGISTMVCFLLVISVLLLCFFVFHI